jgi:AcrR family transcriptional regulator
MARVVSPEPHVEPMAAVPTRRTVLPPEAVLRTARRVFLATGSLEMRALARELGIGRATLYRWNRSRDSLLSDVLLSLAQANFRQVERDVPTPPGGLRVCHVHDLHIRRISGNASFRAFLRSEPEVASRVLLHAHGKVHLGVTRLLADFLRRQEELSDWRAPLGAEAFASVVSRMSETYIYADLIARGEPETHTPDLMLRLMLGLPVTD